MHPSPGEFTILSSYYPHWTLKPRSAVILRLGPTRDSAPDARPLEINDDPDEFDRWHSTTKELLQAVNDLAVGGRGAPTRLYRGRRIPVYFDPARHLAANSDARRRINLVKTEDVRVLVDCSDSRCSAR